MDGVTKGHQLLGFDGNINEKTKHNSEKDFLDREAGGEEGVEEKGMGPASGNSIHRSTSRPQLDLSGAAIQGNFEARDPTILSPN